MSDFLTRSITYIPVAATADGDNVVMAAPGVNKAIQILNYRLRAIGVGDATLRGGAGGTVHLTIAGAAAPGTTEFASGNHRDVGVIQLAANTALVINNAAAQDTIGHMAVRVVQTTII